MEARTPSGGEPEITRRVCPGDGAGDGPTMIDIVLPLEDEDLLVEEETDEWSSPTARNEARIPTLQIELGTIEEIETVAPDQTEEFFAQAETVESPAAPRPSRYPRLLGKSRLARLGLRAILAVVVIGGVFGGLELLTGRAASPPALQITVLAEGADASHH